MTSSHRKAGPARRAKIVCTLGPAVASDEAVLELVELGMDVARLNFSHGHHEDHAAAYERVRKASDRVGRSVGVLADLQGPKIRIGRFSEAGTAWMKGERVCITTEGGAGDRLRISVSYAGLPGDVRPGDPLLVDDGNIVLEVQSVTGADVTCLVVEGGPVGDNKGLSLPAAQVNLPALSEKDLADLRFAVSLRADMIALSFVRGPEQAAELRQVLREHGAEEVGVIAKIERPQAVARLEEVLAAFDGIMVARGDLGVEMPLDEVPLIQKRAVRLARQAGKPVIVATQMLESMTVHGRPTRAEASDVANAVLDGADALMLSAETSLGAHPHAAVRTMSRIILTAEGEASGHAPAIGGSFETRSAAIARAAAQIASDVGACALVAFTQTGSTARRLARHRPITPLLAFTPDPLVRSQLSVSWGIETFVAQTVGTTDEMVDQVSSALRSLGRAEAGDRVVIVAGTPPGVTGTTNTIRVHRLSV